MIVLALFGVLHDKGLEHLVQRVKEWAEDMAVAVPWLLRQSQEAVQKHIHIRQEFHIGTSHVRVASQLSVFFH